MRLRIRRTWPAWAEPGRRYLCGEACGYAFTLQADGTWEKEDLRHPEMASRQVASWMVLEDEYADCSGSLIRRYGGQHAEDQARARRFPRRTLTCMCRGLSPHLHYRGARWFA